MMPICSGAIYDETRIITSASCVLTIDSDYPITVIAGAHDLRLPHLEEHKRIVIKGIQHEDYEQYMYKNDIGILTLDAPLNFTDRVQPIRLAKSNEVPSGDVVTCGHGVDRDEAWYWFNPLLYKATLHTISRDDCNQAFENFEAPAIRDYMVCAGGPKAGLCGGDAGDPLIAKDEAGREYLAGVGSFLASPCGDYPSVFTAIAPFRQWLDSKLNA